MLAERDWKTGKSFFTTTCFHNDGPISSIQINLNLISVFLWSFDPNLVTESLLIGSYNDFSKSRDLYVMTSSVSCLTNATVQSLVTMTLTEKEL